MRLVVKQNDCVINQFQFVKGPIYIGRHPNSQILLRDKAVSRQHAVIFGTHEGRWMVEDLDSANKTYLNDKPIQKGEIKTGDILRIVDFIIEINLENTVDTDKQIPLEDTLITPSNESQIVIRKPDSEHAQCIKLPAKRIKDFIQATESVCETTTLDDVLQALLKIAAKQFTAYHCWCALRNQITGPMTCHAGKKRDGLPVQLSDIKLHDEITQAVEKVQFVLFPRIPAGREKERIHSAMVSPILGQTGCFGVIYIDNAMDHEHYTLSDLDYLMLLAIHTATIVKNF